MNNNNEQLITSISNVTFSNLLYDTSIRLTIPSSNATSSPFPLMRLRFFLCTGPKSPGVTI